MADVNNIFTKTPVTTVNDDHLIIISKSTGEPDVTTKLNLFQKLAAWIVGQTLVFTQKLSAPNGTTGTEVVNYSQLDTKLNKSGGTMTGRLTFDDEGFNIPEFTGTFPTTQSDPQGHVGDIIRSGKRIALKTTADGWCYIDFIRMP